jgi:hypothetical protein
VESLVGLHNLDSTIILTFFMQGPNGSGNTEKFLALLIPSETIPVSAFGVNSEKHHPGATGISLG